MKKKQFLFILLLFSILTFAVACKKNEPMNDIPDQVENDQNSNVYLNAKDRKIIYTVDATIYASSTSFYETKRLLKDLVSNNGWVASENAYDDYANYNLRIATSNLDMFLESLHDLGSVKNLNRSSVDISLDYQNNANKISTLEAERARLVELYKNASLNDMIVINSRISEIDLQLVNLNGTQNQYDSLINYSEVRLTIYGYKQETNRTFIVKIKDAFYSGIKAFLGFLEIVLIVLVVVLPFAVVLVPTGFGVRKLYKRYKKKTDSINKIE
jgi:hypothetical protein